MKNRSQETIYACIIFSKAPRWGGFSLHNFRDGIYSNITLLIYLKALSRFQNFKFLVVLDQQSKVFAYISSWRAIQILEYEVPAWLWKIPELSATVESMKNWHSVIANLDFLYRNMPQNAFAQAVGEGEENTLITDYQLIRSTPQITPLKTDTFDIVLKKMSDNNLEATIVIDEDGKLAGVVERDKLISQLLLSVSK